jgi:2-isopropylmalate synthase
LQSATLGQDALGEVLLEIEHNGETYRGTGVSTDSVEATIMAMLSAINRILTPSTT